MVVNSPGCPVDAESPLAHVRQDAFEAMRTIGVIARTAADPRALFLRAVPGGDHDTGRGRIRDAVAR